MKISSSSSLSATPPNHLPTREIPGTYGLPFLGALKDRWHYFYLQGRDKFFKSRVEKYKSTVFRTNMPPGPWISPDPRVVAVLDANSFPILFDTSKVEKRDVFVGTYMPPLSYTGGHRMCAYLDPSEPKHGSLKDLLLHLLSSKHEEFIPLFQSCAKDMFNELEDRVGDSKKAEFGPLGDRLSFNFMFRLFCDGKRPADTELKSNGSSMVKKWVIDQLSPIGTFGLPKVLYPIEDFLIHSIGLPFFLEKNNYEKLYDVFYLSATSYLDKAEEFGIDREEACHNAVFFAGFNGFGGLNVLFLILLKWIALAGESLHRELVAEIRTTIKAEGGVTMAAINKMSLTKSVIYEALRIEPPVPYQYGKAKEDLVVNSHNAAFKIKKGEMIFGYQPFATKDPKIFDNPEEFVSHRFVGEEGEKLLKYVWWSNGREVDDPTKDNKQCPAKDLVVLLSRVFLVEFFIRYDTFSAQVGSSSFSPTVTITSLTKAAASG